MTPQPRWSLTAAEVALAALTAAAVTGLTGVLVGSWLATAAVAVVVAHTTTTVFRRRGTPLWLAGTATMTLGVLTAVWLAVPQTTVAGIPTARTPGVVTDAVLEAWDLLRTGVAPVPTEPGFVIAITVAVFAVATLADWAAFRLWALVEAVVPATTLFVFTVLVGANNSATWPAVVFAGALAAVLFTHHQARMLGSSRWVSSTPRIPGSVVTRGAVVVAAAVAAGVVVAPALPGAGQPPIVDWASSPTSSQRVTVSPMVDIRGRMVDQSDQLMFTVAATAPSYWRLTSLETFDDGIWKSSGSYVAASGSLGGSRRPGTGSTVVEQRFDMANLAAVWLPAAWEPTAVDSPAPVRWHAESATLMVDNDTESSDGLVYAVQSEFPVLDPAALERGGQPLDPQIAATFVALPADLSPLPGRVASEVTADAATPYAQARALQDWFRTNFTYDLEVPAGHDDDAIETFLARRSGYCEQFAGTFAVMARTLGIPARVAVGFTPGNPVPSQPGVYEVLGLHAHAWPEVWIDGAGWVPFEPTPGRGAPGAEAWTGQPALQEGGTPQRPEPVPGPTVVDEPTVDDGVTPPGPLPDSSEPPLFPDGEMTTDVGSGVTTVAGWFAAVVLTTFGLYVAATAVARRVVRYRRYRDRTPAGRILAAWGESQQALTCVGVARNRAETTDAFVSRVGSVLPAVATDLTVVAQLADAAQFSGHTFGPDEASEAVVRAKAVTGHLAAVRTLRQRLRYLLSPEPWRLLVTQSPVILHSHHQELVVR